ncbi:hypothetical protein [Amycolatopsis sp. DSM 110486]|uniref:hypothetical protein n=1 Tax=Amycolatopsis sp. DSM 110486 TaxID=2865832 RepID=UPI001C69E729|nr:hypothetical protein [Amycolatopsis sp. DSM 110486]QYN20425.1 hypothetical protein K1T34_49380 [Amycolatopsis sp. DSM 110486]
MDRNLQELAGVIGMFALVIVITATQIGAVRREKARRVRDDDYRKLAEEGLASLRNIERQLTEMRTQMNSVERILQQVE